MADSKMEQVLQALFATLQANVPAGVLLERNGSLPTRIPDAGYMSLRDGDPGEPEALLCPPLYVYEHFSEIDVVVELATSTARDAQFDVLKRAIGAAIEADRSLGGLCDYVLGDAPAPLELPMEGAENMKAATVGVILTYGTSDPLA